MTGFNISSLLNFNPADYQCFKCFSLFKKEKFSIEMWSDYYLFKEIRYSVNSPSTRKCESCGVHYEIIRLNDSPHNELYKVLESNRCISTIDDLIIHSKSLARIANDLNGKNSKYPPIKGLLAALNQAK